MKQINILLTATFLLICGCVAVQAHDYVDATAWSANYTEDFIYEFRVQTALGKETGLEGINVSEFHRGGKGAQECCSLIPGVGKPVRIVWKIGGRNDDEAQWKTYSKEVVIKGVMPKNPNQAPHSVLIVRFFANHEVEAELMPGDGIFGSNNARVDRLFFVGPRVMRHIGD